MKTCYYTVLLDTPGFPVRYLNPITLNIDTFASPVACSDPGEASQEFQAHMPGQHCYLNAAQFQDCIEITGAWKALQAVPSYLEMQAAAFAQEECTNAL